MRTFPIVVTLTAAFCLVAVAASRTPAAAAHPDVTIKMHAQNGSGEWGTATLTDLSGRTRVVIALQHENTLGNQPAHVHLGSCAKLGGAKYPLKNVVLGHSNTVVDVPITAMLGGRMAINVHESASQLGKYVSCGDIP